MNIIIKWHGEQNFLGIDENHNYLRISPRNHEGVVYSPPDLLLMSLGSCTGLFIIPSVKELGAKISDFEITLKGIKSKTPPNLFDKIVEEISLTGISDLELAERIVAKAHSRCFILKSLNPNIKIETKINIFN